MIAEKHYFVFLERAEKDEAMTPNAAGRRTEFEAAFLPNRYSLKRHHQLLNYTLRDQEPPSITIHISSFLYTPLAQLFLGEAAGLLVFVS